MPNQNKIIQLGLQYVVIPQNTQDIEEYRKDVIIASHKATPITLWQNYAAQANEATAEIDLSTMTGMSIYVSFSGATTINIQAKTATSLDGSGWSTFNSDTFAASSYQIYNIWTLPFTKIRLQTTNAVTITAQVFKKT